ncbi:hypothetical protein KVR01_001308 [Diaporthe batatas]|uniref:uncharacterized protein n=1 Tax=Diaporthe batatas TaxID=748121 RepID=UPI001D05B555|nr:uncharacterized protein KVR01_001308 [Diaporthe batatas]KAG8168559.1 hypothetical protein KVR01_001308 [Diaporthe batatas]
MISAKYLLFFSVIFGLTTASPTFMVALAPQAPRSPSLADDHHLCTTPTSPFYQYGNQSYPERVRADCEKLSQELKTQADRHGNFTEACGVPAGYKQFGKEGDCTLFLMCYKTTEGNAVTMGYGDVADIIKMAIDGLQGSGQSDNSSIVAISTSFGCQHLAADWVVAL